MTDDGRQRPIVQQWDRREDVLKATGTDAATAENGADADHGTNDPLGGLSRLLSRQAGLILNSAEAQNGVLNKAQLDALSSLIKLAEKFETLAQERAKEEQTRSDDEVAAVLERIDDRIVELAEGYAEKLGAPKSDGG